MSTTSQNKFDDQEIDLSAVLQKKIKSIAIILFDIILFFKKYFIVIIGLIIIGVSISYFLDKYSKQIYKNEVIVIPNYDSSDYLYNTIQNINSKINLVDSQFFNTIGLTEYNRLKKIKIEPITDIYNFLSDKKKYDIFKILTEGKDVNKVIRDSITSKKNKYYKINIYLSDKDDKGVVIDKILKYLNKNEYYNDYKTINIAYIKNKIEKNNQMIAQIDAILNMYSNSTKNEISNNNQFILLNKESSLDKLFESKEKLIEDIKILELDLIDGKKLINDISINYNIQSSDDDLHLIRTEYISIYLLLIFIGFFLIKNIYIRLEQVAKNKV